MLLLVLASVLAGATLQRVSGIGFAMVVAPFTVIALGPAQGVVLVQVCGVASAALVLSRVVRDTDWATFARLLPGSALGVVAGALLAGRVPDGPAQVLSAVVMLVTLAASVLVGRLRELPRSPVVLTAAGGTAGLMTVLAGVGGVALTALQQATRWEHRVFLATLQPYLIALSTGTVVARVVVSPAAWPSLSPAAWAGVAAALAVGILAGGRAARWLSGPAAARVTLALSLAGAVVALVDGLVGP
ncbi:TSUP family transporter [Cellulomonas sp. HD19AZ1]|uniref:TSUP family transporter n=1 Tax=Cellulomonas sp. HD19AZ1 TaxID=2559593 RepID=UPI0014320A6A|nr:TSUP family transporter [Cellulomonas sp. HD19AZ1]